MLIRHSHRVTTSNPKKASYQKPPVFTRVDDAHTPVGAAITLDGPLTSAHMHFGPDGALICVGRTTKFRITPE